MCIWETNTQRSGTLDLHSNLGRPILAKPSQWHGKPAKVTLANIWRRKGCLISLLWEQDQDGPLRSSIIDTIATQVCLNQQQVHGKLHSE
jgi:hypothetical protein